jgi:hypothetical protein
MDKLPSPALFFFVLVLGAMPPKRGFGRKATTNRTTVPPKICQRCGLDFRGKILDHDRLCRIRTENRRVLIQHAHRRRQNRDSHEASQPSTRVSQCAASPVQPLSAILECRPQCSHGR